MINNLLNRLNDPATLHGSGRMGANGSVNVLSTRVESLFHEHAEWNTEAG